MTRATSLKTKPLPRSEDDPYDTEMDTDDERPLPPRNSNSFAYGYEFGTIEMVYGTLVGDDNDDLIAQFGLPWLQVQSLLSHVRALQEKYSNSGRVPFFAGFEHRPDMRAEIVRKELEVYNALNVTNRYRRLRMGQSWVLLFGSCVDLKRTWNADGKLRTYEGLLSSTSALLANLVDLNDREAEFLTNTRVMMNDAWADFRREARKVREEWVSGYEERYGPL